MNWDDLRVLQAVHDAGTYAGASVSLHIDETTVARRLARVQEALGMPLFELVDGKRRPSPQCEAIVGHTRAIARHVSEIGAVGKQVAGPIGRFRIAATNTIAETLLAPRTGSFLTAHSGLTLQFLTSSENVDLSRWEADLAVRLRRPEKGDFSISKLGALRLYFFEPAEPLLGGEPIVCCYPSELAATPEAEFVTARFGDAAARCVTDNVRIVRSLILSRRAVGVLPEYLCADLLEDARLRASPLPKRREVWLLVQNHLKRDRAAQLVIEWIRDCMAA